MRKYAINRGLIKKPWLQLVQTSICNKHDIFAFKTTLIIAILYALASSSSRVATRSLDSSSQRGSSTHTVLPSCSVMVTVMTSLRIEYYGLSRIIQAEGWGEKNSCEVEVNMELSAVGERVFAAESIIKRRIRRVSARNSLLVSASALLQRRLVICLCPLTF